MGDAFDSVEVDPQHRDSEAAEAGSTGYLPRDPVSSEVDGRGDFPDSGELGARS